MFLRFELDQYLRGRGQERNEEYPLYNVDPNQGYIHYNKGAMVMYALQDYIGEDKVNQAIREFLKAHAFQGPAVSDVARTGRLFPQGHAAGIPVPVRRHVPEHHAVRQPRCIRRLHSAA